MFGLIRRLVSAPSTCSSPTPVRSRALVEGLEGRSMMSVSLNPGSEAALLPAVQHGLLLPAVHPAGVSAPSGNLSPTTGFIIAVL
jgi:hypothetical protein